jgi:predicted RNA binding protein YcfA (HicA-like mRNA interferase family)
MLHITVKVKKVKFSLKEAVAGHSVVRCRGSHIFLDNRLAYGGEAVSLTRC